MTNLSHTTTSQPRFMRIYLSIITLAGLGFFVLGMLTFFDDPSLNRMLFYTLIASILIGISSAFAVAGYRNLSKRGVYFHLFTLIVQLEQIWIFSLFQTSHRSYLPLILVILFLLSFVVAVLMSIHLQVAPFIVVIVISVGLTCMSFAYQKTGPETRAYGNAGCEIQPNKYPCVNGWVYMEVLGAGFPLQYALDSFATSVKHSIGSEDDFLVLPFLADILFYTAIIHGSIKLTQRWREKSNRGFPDVI